MKRRDFLRLVAASVVASECIDNVFAEQSTVKEVPAAVKPVGGDKWEKGYYAIFRDVRGWVWNGRRQEFVPPEYKEEELEDIAVPFRDGKDDLYLVGVPPLCKSASVHCMLIVKNGKPSFWDMPVCYIPFRDFLKSTTMFLR